MKTTRKITSIILTLALVLTMSVTAFAAWDQYQGNANHNGQITDAAPLTGALTSSNYRTPTLNSEGNGWSGVDTAPVMETYGGNTYAYVVYNGRTYGGQLSRINCSNASDPVVSVQLSTANSFQLSTPYLDTANGKIYVAVTDYLRIMGNNEFTTTEDWTLSGGATITTAAADENAYVTIPSGGSISQPFSYTATSANKTQLTSGLKLVSDGGSATVTYTLEKPDETEVTLATQTVDSSSDWTYVEELGSADLDTTGTYTLKVSVTGAAVVCDYVTYSKSTSGIKVINRDLSVNSFKDVAYATQGGQINTPLVSDGRYLYFGTYSGGFQYYQVDLLNSNPATNTKSFTGANHFYWAGAYTDGTYVYFGCDGGKLYKLTAASFGSTESTTMVDLSQYAPNPGNVRSNMMFHDGYLYFTSQGVSQQGYLWKYRVSDGDITYASIGATSTSTPVISENGYLYIGCYGSSIKGVKALKLEDFNDDITSATDAKWISIYDGASVQASVIVYTSAVDECDYVYFTTNVGNGSGHCYYLTKDDTSDYGLVWSTPEGTYTLQGMAACSGYLTFGDDNNNFYVIH